MQQKPFGNTCHSYPEVADKIGHLKFFSKGPKHTGGRCEGYRGERAQNIQLIRCIAVFV